MPGLLLASAEGVVGKVAVLGGGCAIIGGSICLIVGAFLKDLGGQIDHWEWASKGAIYGGLFGLAWVVAKLV